MEQKCISKVKLYPPISREERLRQVKEEIARYRNIIDLQIESEQKFLRAIDHENNALRYYFANKYFYNPNKHISKAKKQYIFNKLKEINDKFNRRTIV